MIVYKKYIGPDIGIWRRYECWVNNGIFVCLIISSWVRRVVGFPLPHYSLFLDAYLSFMYLFVFVFVFVLYVHLQTNKHTHSFVANS